MALTDRLTVLVDWLAWWALAAYGVVALYAMLAGGAYGPVVAGIAALGFWSVATDLLDPPEDHVHEDEIEEDAA